jgi:large subunit ribosomal protein L22
MEIKAKLNYLRVSPRKARLITDFIKGMELKQAENHLRFTPQRISGHLLKLLHSAASNAQNNFKIDKDILYIKDIIVNEGTPFKRWHPVSRGRAFPIMKRTSNINLVLGVKKGVKPKKLPIAKTQKEEEIQKDLKTIKKISKKSKPEAPRELGKISKIKGLTKKIFRRKSF